MCRRIAAWFLSPCRLSIVPIFFPPPPLTRLQLDMRRRANIPGRGNNSCPCETSFPEVYPARDLATTPSGRTSASWVLPVNKKVERQRTSPNSAQPHDMYRCGGEGVKRYRCVIGSGFEIYCRHRMAHDSGLGVCLVVREGGTQSELRSDRADGGQEALRFHGLEPARQGCTRSMHVPTQTDCGWSTTSVVWYLHHATPRWGS